jgi:hypothetical protein
MADGDVLQLDSSEPGGSGEILGEDKYKWAPPSGGSLPCTFSVLSEETLSLANNSDGDGTPFTPPAGTMMFIVHEVTDAEEDDEVFLAFNNTRIQFYLKATDTPGEWVVHWRNDGGHGARSAHVAVIGVTIP